MANPIVLLAFACAFLNANTIANPLDDELGQAGDPPSPDRPTSVFLKTAAVIEQPNGGAVTVTQPGPGSPVKGNDDSKTEGGGDISTVYDTQEPTSTAVVSQKQDGGLSTVDSPEQPKSTPTSTKASSSSKASSTTAPPPPPPSTSSAKTTSKPTSSTSTRRSNNRPVRQANYKNIEPEPLPDNNKNSLKSSSSVELTGALAPTGTIQPAATIAASGDPQMAAVENGEGEFDDMMDNSGNAKIPNAPDLDLPDIPNPVNVDNFGIKNKAGSQQKKKSTTSVVYTLVSKYGEKMSIPAFLDGVPIVGPDGKPTATAHAANAVNIPTTPTVPEAESEEDLTQTFASVEISSTASPVEESSSTSVTSATTTSVDTSMPSTSASSSEGDNKYSLQGIPAGGRVPNPGEDQPPARVPDSLNIKAGDSDNEVDTPVANGGRVGNNVPVGLDETGVAIEKTSSDLTTTIIISVTDTVRVTRHGPTITSTAVAYQRGGRSQGLAKRRIPPLAENEIVDFGAAEDTVTSTKGDVSLTVQETETPSTAAVVTSQPSKVTSQPTKITDEPALQTDVQDPVSNISDTPTVPATQTQLPTGPESITVSSLLMPTGPGVNMTVLSSLTSGANLTTDTSTDGNLSTKLQTASTDSATAASTSNETKTSIPVPKPSSVQSPAIQTNPQLSEAEQQLYNMLPPLVTSQPPLVTSQPALVTTQPVAATVPAGMDSGSAAESGEGGESAVALDPVSGEKVVPYLTLYSTINNRKGTTSAHPTTVSTKIKAN
ncbi:hypothetical protein TRICI_004912 [Trichomonascus ciferrii]|uniref:Uncharacterized protein n=1 Tax=Trichomonascus ciferrii TaxID=44093 RepID=A0A642UXR5_9ASCO|nr:hypothetical protein TRICI_004912 [Trichomonascus ciferrii]